MLDCGEWGGELSKVTERRRPKDFAESVLSLCCCSFSMLVLYDIDVLLQSEILQRQHQASRFFDLPPVITIDHPPLTPEKTESRIHSCL